MVHSLKRSTRGTLSPSCSVWSTDSSSYRTFEQGAFIRMEVLAVRFVWRLK